MARIGAAADSGRGAEQRRRKRRQEAAKVKSMPGSLDESLSALEHDQTFLLKGDVFTADVIETWLGYKRKKEPDPVRLRPHPYEFALYFDI